MIIRNLLIIGSILGIAFLSQQPWLNSTTQTYVFPFFEKGQAYASGTFLGKTGDWLQDNVYSKFTNEAEKRGEIAKEELSTQKDNAIQNSFDSTKKFIAEKTLQTLGVKPEDLNPACNP